MKKKGYCCFCFSKYDNYGNDIRPLISSTGTRCCDRCNQSVVIPNRIKFWFTNVQEMYVIKDTRDGHYLDCTLQSNSAIKLYSDYTLKFYTLEDAEQCIRQNKLEHCEPVKILLREDD